MPTALSPNSSRDGRSPTIDVSQFNSVAEIIKACDGDQRLAKYKCRAWNDMRLAKLDARENMKALLDHLNSDEFQQRLESALESSENRFSKNAFIDDLKNYLTDERLDSWERLAKSSPSVLESACMKIAALGLSPNHRLGYAWFLPTRCAYEGIALSAVPGVRGMEMAVMSTNKVKKIDRGIIREQDHYEFEEGDNPYVKVRKNLKVDNSKPNPIIGSWASIQFKDGVNIVQVSPINENELKAGFMGLEKSAEYQAERSALRIAMQTKLHADKMSEHYLNALSEASLNVDEQQEATSNVVEAKKEVQQPEASKVIIEDVDVDAPEVPAKKVNKKNVGEILEEDAEVLSKSMRSRL